MVWKLLLTGIVLPAVVSGTILLISYLLWRRLPFNITQAALCLGYTAGYTGIGGLPSMPPADASQWTVYAAILAVAVSTLYTAFSFRKKADYILMAMFSCGLSFFLLRPLLQYRWSDMEGFFWISGTGALIFTLWLLVIKEAETPGLLPLSSAMLITVAFSGLTLLFSGSAMLGQLAGAFTAALLPAAIAAFRPPSGHHFRKVMPVSVVVVAGLWINGYFFAEMPVWSIAFLLIALCAPMFVKAAGIHRRSPLKQALITGTASAIPSSLALAIAVIHYV